MARIPDRDLLRPSILESITSTLYGVNLYIPCHIQILGPRVLSKGAVCLKLLAIEAGYATSATQKGYASLEAV